MIRDGVLPDEIYNYAHNNEWLIRDLNAIGRVHDAIELSKNMLDLPRHPKYNLPDHGGSSSHFGRIRLISTLVQYEHWSELVALCAIALSAAAEYSGRQNRTGPAAGPSRG